MLKYRLFVVIAVATLVALPALTLQAETVGFWQFEEQAAGTQTTGAADELLDSSGNGHHGYAAGTSKPFYVAAPAGFDPDTGITLTSSSNWLVVPDNDVFNMKFSELGDWELEFDLKAATSQGTDAVIFAKRNSGVGYYLRLHNGYLQMSLQNATNWSTSTSMIGSTSLKDAIWHNIKVAIHADADADLSSVTYYVDDVVDGTFLLKDAMTAGTPDSWDNQDIVNDVDVTMGNWSYSSARYFNGDVSMAKFSYSPVPEPSTLALLATGLIGLLAYAWRKRK